VWLLAAPLAAQPSHEPASAPTSVEAAPAPPAAHKVSVSDTQVFTLSAPLGTRTADERARQATKALADFTKTAESPTVTVVREDSLLAVYVDKTAIVRLSQADADAAGEASPETLANEIASDIRRALEAERRRSRIANQVFSVSLVVFFGLIAFYLMRRVAGFTEQVRAWVEANGEKLTVKIREVEVVRTEMVQSASLVVLGLLRWLGMGAVLYVWLVASLSLFGLTQFTERLTGIVLSPLSQLTTRLATTLPLLVVALIAGLAVFVLVRFVDLLFAGVAKRETTLVWVPADLAIPTSILLRLGIVIAALLFAAPVVTGDSEGAFPRVGLVILAALALGSVPLVASALVGVVVLFGRRLRLHDFVQIGQVEGRVVHLDLLEVRLSTDQGETRIPMLTLLRVPLKKLGTPLRAWCRVSVQSDTNLETIESTLRSAAMDVLRNVRVELESADKEGLCYRVLGEVDSPTDRGRLLSTVVAGLGRAGIGLGRLRGGHER
jgi:small-conductance mechanosensitive channel